MPASLTWQKSSFSGGGEANACVELATSPAGIHLRESDDPGELLTTTRDQLGAFLRAAKAGEFDHLAP
ncbi:DUF397 domain-containing protein [Streptomyces sp. NPDC005962]|uniref:DUF397 domain-containing protein n=1 Tax=Streptomyces sp. NPDC005962 TaxID=3154466 RepID=UPI0033D9E974